MTNPKRQRLLIISPHLDDEVLGCGGLIAKIKDGGGEVYVLFLVNGNTKDFSKNGSSTKNERQQEVEQVADFLGYNDYHIAFEKNPYHLKLDQIPQLDLITAIERGTRISIEKIRPTVILLPHLESYNQDHRAAALATFTACRPAANNLKFQPKMVLSYESPTDQWSLKRPPKPNIFIELSSDHLEKKLAAVKLYKSQLRDHPNPRSLDTLKSLAVTRGAQSGSHLAEAFVCHRFIS